MRIELALLALLAAAALWAGGNPLDLRSETWFHYSFLGHFYWFALGLSLAVVSVAYSNRRHPPRALHFVEANPMLWWAAGLGVYLITVLAFSEAPFVFDFNNSEYLLMNLIQGVGGVLFFLPAVFGNPNRGLPARILGHPALMWVGLISYGLLLWHGTVAVMLGSLFGSGEGYWTVLIAEIVVAVPMAMLSYYLVERPLMKFKYRSPREVFRRKSSRERRPLTDPGGS